MNSIRRCVPLLPPSALVLLSSQLPVGTCAQLEREFGASGYRFACSPENLRLGRAIDVFSHADRIIAGCREERTREQLTQLFAPFTRQVVWMRPESAEMTKHAINGFLALSIAYMNEIARVCEKTGADAKEVERGLKTESRIGPQAYLSPGGAFAGGTLARDVVTLGDVARDQKLKLELIPAIKRSNDAHRAWTIETLRQRFAGKAKPVVTLLGLTYKPGTDTLRRSSAVELAQALQRDGFRVRASDPSNPRLPSELSFIEFNASPAALAGQASVLVVCTPWPEFRELDWPALLSGREVLVVDAARVLEKQVGNLPGVTYVAVGSPA
jgi:UDPglucose 6-dehydrogenase